MDASRVFVLENEDTQPLTQSDAASPVDAESRCIVWPHVAACGDDAVACGGVRWITHAHA